MSAGRSPGTDFLCSGEAFGFSSFRRGYGHRNMIPICEDLEMITERQPDDWRELQSEVARILAECGMQADLEKTVLLARGTAEVDVVAVESVNGRKNIIYCECKFWKNPIPKNVIHGFRTVVEDGGANAGYVITSSGFQSGARIAAGLTNVRLVTWPEFQEEFEGTWIENHLRPQVTKRLDELMELVEPLLPRAFRELDAPAKANFLDLRERYWELGATAMMFTTHIQMLRSELPKLPLRDRMGSRVTRLPDELLDSPAYGDFLDNLLRFGERATAELRAALWPEAKPFATCEEKSSEPPR